ncbi:MAG TPA: hypothetical protein VJO33_05420 [Gemmatimonadaceae bacterium]|nr:hypothetical protein [Gemmatimonadaceae bacterium]
MEGLDDVFGEPNGAAYVKREERVGPPLSYVQEKLVGSLKSLHQLARSLSEQLPGSSPKPNAAKGDAYDRTRDAISGWAERAFYLELVAFLALSNMLALVEDDSLVDRLLGYEVQE